MGRRFERWRGEWVEGRGVGVATRMSGEVERWRGQGNEGWVEGGK